MNFDAFRVSVQNALGFETFYPERLDDSVEIYAFLVPPGISEKVRDDLGNYISAMFQNAGRICEGVTWHDCGSYQFNWCGSRHITASFDTHLVFWLSNDQSEPVPLVELPPKPQLDRWIVVEVEYDHVRADLYPDSCMRFDSVYAVATVEGKYMDTKHRLINSVKESIQRIYTM